MRSQPAEIVRELIRTRRRKFSQTRNARTRPQSPLFSLSATPAFGIPVNKPRALRRAKSLDRRRIGLTGLHSFLSSHLGNQRAIYPIEPHVRRGE
jgi:hypothetical protein